MLIKLKDLILNNNWHTLPKNASDSITVELKSYDKIKNSLIYNNHHEVILKDNCIVLLKVYHKIAITLEHQWHQGIIKTKALLRSKVFFFNMNKLVEEEIGNCITCQSLTPPRPPPPIISTKVPQKVGKTININYLGSLPNGKYCLVLIDQRSRYPIVAFTTSTDATSLLKVLENVFAQYGLPDIVIADNGLPFSSTNVQNYFKSKRIYHLKITPRWPRANG